MIDDDLAKDFSDLIIEGNMHDNCFDVAKNKSAILTFEKGWKFKTRRLAETSVTRLGNLLDFGQLFKAFGSN